MITKGISNTFSSKIPKSLYNTADDAVPSAYSKVSTPKVKVSQSSTGTGYPSHKAMVKDIGRAGDGYEWHHIVEQSQIKKSGFAPESIHNTSNIIKVDKATHRLISGLYNSKQKYSNNLRVRDWLASQSFEDQRAFGMNVLKDFGVYK